MFGVDCLFVGLVDFVVSFGYFGDICYLDVEIVMVCVFVVGKQVGVVVGIFVGDMVVVCQYCEVGYWMIMVLVDVSWLLCVMWQVLQEVWL